MAFETRPYYISGWPGTYNIGWPQTGSLLSDRIYKHATSYLSIMVDFHNALLTAFCSFQQFSRFM